MQLELITSDVFDVADRLKSINDGYRVYYNKEKSRFEVHNVYQHGNTLAFVVPYKTLDKRTVDYANETRIENAEKLFGQVAE